MTRLLLTHIDILATMNDRPAGAHSCGEELSDAALLIENGVISEVGSSAALSQHISRVDEVIGPVRSYRYPGPSQYASSFVSEFNPPYSRSAE